MPDKAEMKFKEYDVYHEYYCGLCRMLKHRYGIAGQFSLSYDMTFLTILLSSLYEPKEKKNSDRCMVHMLRKHSYRVNKYTTYTADMNLLLSYYKSMDDWNDEHDILKKFYADCVSKKTKKVAKQYEKKAEKIARYMRKLSEAEKKNETNIDMMAGYFGKITAELFAVKEDEWENGLRKMGYALGCYIYIMDAYDDVLDDVKKGHYNPFADRYLNEDFDKFVFDILKMWAAECAREFEKLPVVENVSILRNILYAGIWTRYKEVYNKRHEKKDENA